MGGIYSNYSSYELGRDARNEFLSVEDEIQQKIIALMEKNPKFSWFASEGFWNMVEKHRK
jgi:hypothetical protein